MPDHSGLKIKGSDARTRPAPLLIAGIALASFRRCGSGATRGPYPFRHAMFQVLVSPGTVGGDSFVLQLMSGDGNLLRVKEATLILSLPERGIEPLERKATLGPTAIGMSATCHCRSPAAGMCGSRP